ncbi:MAG: peptidoglycan DD-metalloendopeptidase family protein [Stellaceae bacterium]
MPFQRGFGPICLIALLALGGMAPPLVAATLAPSDAQIGQLDAIRQQCIAAAQAVQTRERSIGALDIALRTMQSGIDGKAKELATSREQQKALLGALERLALAPPETLALTSESPVDRTRSAILLEAAVPMLSAKVRELSSQLAALATTRDQIDAHQKDIDAARVALAQGRAALAQLVTRRNALTSRLLHDDDRQTASASPVDQARDLSDLINKADAATDQRDKELLVRLKALHTVPGKTALDPSDPTKPKTLRALDAPQAQMVWPVSGEIARRFGDADRSGQSSQGLTMQGVPDGVVVAPFDGEVDYVGRSEGYGLILIIRHAGGYHSLLAGLGHVDVMMGQWLLAGEPVGSLPDADGKGAGANFYFELGRDGRPVDPQSRLESRDQKTEDIRVRE